MVQVQGHWDPIFGRLTIAELPLNDPIVLGAFIFSVLVGVTLLGAATYYKLWPTIWRDWMTTVEH